MAKYTARPGSPISDKDAKVIGGVIEHIRSSGRQVTPKVLLEEARSPNSPVHRYFDWDDESAAQKQRIEWARTLIGAIQIVEVRVQRPSKAFYSVSMAEVSGGEARQYHTRREVMSVAPARDQVLLRLQRTIQAALADAESLGAESVDPWWKRMIETSKRGAPLQMKKEALAG